MAENEEKKPEAEAAPAATEQAKSADNPAATTEAPKKRERTRGGKAGGERRRKRGDRKEEKPDREFSETLIDIYRCSATVKGGRRLSFGALVTVGNGKGKVGIGYAKAKEVPGAIQKAIKKARKDLITFEICEGDTIPHTIKGRFGASEVIFLPARAGTGVIAGAAVKAILEASGLKNVLTKSVGSNNTRNIVKATLDALQRMRSKETVAKLRGVEL